MPSDYDLERIKEQILLANIQELLRKISQRCFEECVQVPDVELRGIERDCLTNCMDRFMDSLQLVSRQYFRRRIRQHRSRKNPDKYKSEKQQAT
ncbi:mitochondrial import inner membrane translocase subunit Tim13 [Drosophila tropicalis]|uniref:mitochondrial import inner membrane translocase subunit Tim13 n=1 Tax=Drosophila tropicalis TaxID=46794 RepID=UPI0035ABD3A3